MGKFTALIIASEIDDIKRFPDPDKLVGYMGLAPSVRNSAGIVHHGRITRAGNKMVRWILVEAVLSHRIHAKEETALTGVLQAHCKKKGILQGHSCHCGQDAAHHVLDAKKTD